MSSFLVLAFLVGTLLIVLYRRWLPTLHEDHPLDVEAGLPIPWAGFASTIFSLTALFGAYFGIFLLKGFAAAVGLVLGSCFGLVLLHRWIKRSGARRFDEFLATRILMADSTSDEMFWMLFVATQLGFACSELIILTRLADVGLHLGPALATIFAISASVIAYLYCLVGGYVGVYRTDIPQFIAVAVLCTIAAIGAAREVGGGSDLSIQISDPLYWSLGLRLSRIAQIVVDVFVGAVMGLGFLFASPDTWKRLFLIGSSSRSTLVTVGGLSLAGGIPFLALVPLVILVHSNGSHLTDPMDLLARGIGHGLVTTVVVIGLLASFLSSFDSALISAAHLLHSKVRRARYPTLSGRARYQLYLGVSFLVVSFTAVAIASRTTNVYICATVLMGPFAIIAGTLAGSGMFEGARTRSCFGWLLLLGVVGWIIYILSRSGAWQEANPEQIQTVPVAVTLFIIFAGLSRASRLTGGRRG